jgi:hypothetical protein
MTSLLSSDEVKSCRVFFNNFDRTKCGQINTWELQVTNIKTTNTTEKEHSHIHMKKFFFVVVVFLVISLYL